MLLRILWVFLCWVLPLSALDFAHDVRPILSDNCFQCHGPDKHKREAKLRLDDRNAAVKVGAFVPGKPDDSELVFRVETDEDEERMPPPESGLTLTAEQKKALRDWIASGAEYQQHWAFEPVQKPVAPEVVVAWRKNFIDDYVWRSLKARSMKPQQSARRETLLRRVTFDLTGLPPTLAAIDAFLEDDTPDAYQRVVDSLLNSTAYGERMANEWMDVARYADTYGFQRDRDRFVWPWRDWVIKAFNENLSYRDFIVWQLAGDCLPDPSHEQILATTFNRLHQQKVEGGSVEEEFRVEYVADRTHTFGTAFLGLTLECARCHDHKFDPISQRDYYRFFAYFNNIDEAGLYSFFTPSVPTPTMLVQETDIKKATDVNDAVRIQEKVLADIAAGAHDAFAGWKAPPLFALNGKVAHYTFDEPTSGKHANQVDAKTSATTPTANVSVEGKRGRALRLTGDDAVKTNVGAFNRCDPFSIAIWVQPPERLERAVIASRSKAWTDAGSRGYEILLNHGRVQFSLIHFWPGNAISVRTQDPLPVDAWTHITVTYDGSSRANGLQIYLNGTVVETEIVRDALTKKITGGGVPHLVLGERFRDNGFKNGLVDDLQVFNRQLTRPEIAQVSGAEPVDALGMFETFLHTAYEPFRKQLGVLQEARRKRSQRVDGLAEIMVMKDMPKRRPTYVLERGHYDSHGEEVAPGTPDVLPALPAGMKNDRLALAQWLVDPNHPLTSRVTVNRYWQLFFGRGLVATSENFGSQADRPTHPELLDALALDFMESGWDLKALCRRIVMSSTYRQSSKAPRQMLRDDPDNALLARGPSHRLSAEMIRDHALAVSGLLVERVGGASVKPYDIALSFKPSKHDQGEGLYRRSLYTYWRLTAAAPAMMTFNAAQRNVCTVRRENTSSPLQALILMNSPQFVEAARVVGTHAVNAYGDDEGALIAHIYKTLIGRDINEAERTILSSLYREQLTHFEENTQAATLFLKNGNAKIETNRPNHQIAAAGVVASALFSYDECLMKR